MQLINIIFPLGTITKLYENFPTYPETTLALMHVKCVTLQVRECADMISINNQ
jgi:hypothetical protein